MMGFGYRLYPSYELELFGTVEFDPDYDYKQQCNRQ